MITCRSVPRLAHIARLLVTCLCTVSLLAGCGYLWRGETGSLSEDSLLGNGSKTLRINAIEQTTLYPWLPYMIRSQLRDDITARGLAQWKDSGTTDFTLSVRVNSFQVRSYGQEDERNLLFTATINMEFILYNGGTNTIVWTSGPTYYSDNFESANEEQAIREVVQMVIRRGVDRLQQRF